MSDLYLPQSTILLPPGYGKAVEFPPPRMDEAEMIAREIIRRNFPVDMPGQGGGGGAGAPPDPYQQDRSAVMPETTQLGYGRTERIFANGQVTTLGRISFGSSVSATRAMQALTFAVSPTFTQTNAVSTQFVWAKVTFGTGGVAITRLLDISCGGDFPIIGESVDVKVFIGDATGTPLVVAGSGPTFTQGEQAAVFNPGVWSYSGVPLASTAPFADVSLSIGTGSRGLPQVNSSVFFKRTSDGSTKTFTSSNEAVVFVGSTRLKGFRTFLTSGGPDVLMVFDKAALPVAGDIPVLMVPMPPAATGNGPPPQDFSQAPIHFKFGVTVALDSQAHAAAESFNGPDAGAAMIFHPEFFNF